MVSVPPLPGSEWNPQLPDEHARAKSDERKRTRDDIATITSFLESADIPCCLVGVAALQHFGAKRVSDEIDICVPAASIHDARLVLLNRPDLYAPMTPRNRFDLTNQRHTFPWFRQPGVHVFFVLIPDSALNFSCVPGNIERSSLPLGLPRPKPALWIEALIDTGGFALVDLDDMVDGLALSEEWGRLNLGERYLPRFIKSVQGISNRMGYKYSTDEYVTRFRRRKDILPLASDE